MKKYIVLLLMLLACSPAFSQKAKHHHKTVHHRTVKHKTVKHKVKHKAIAKKHVRKAVVHHGRHKAMHHVVKAHHYNVPASPIFVDTHTNSATVEIRNGKLFINDEAVYTLKNRKGEDQKVIISYPTPEPPAPAPQPEPASAPDAAEQTGGIPLLGVHTYDGCEDGATVGNVLPGSAADEAGLWRGDVIRKIDDEEIGNSAQLEKSILAHKVGDKVQINYLHHRESKSADATLGDKEKMSTDCDCDMWEH